MSMGKAYDVQVEYVQIWLNETYGEKFAEAGYEVPIDDNLNYELVPFKPTAYTNGNTYYALSDDWNAITIHEYPRT